MKNIIFLFLTLAVISCANNSDFLPSEDTIFGYDLEEFSKEKIARYANGECWGTLQEYSKEEIKIVADKFQCSDYNFSQHYLLFKNGKINTAYSVVFEPTMEEKTTPKKYATIESIYNFSAEPPHILRRTETLDNQNVALLTTDYDTLIMENVAAEYEAFTNRIQVAKSQILKDGEILVALTHGEVKIDEKALVPQMDIFMTSSIFGKTVFLSKEFNLNKIETAKKRQDFGIPTIANFAFYSWFAGKGNCYYGIIENDNLVVFRKLLKEKKAEELPFEVFNKYPIVNPVE